MFKQLAQKKVPITILNCDNDNDNGNLGFETQEDLETASFFGQIQNQNVINTRSLAFSPKSLIFTISFRYLSSGV